MDSNLPNQNSGQASQPSIPQDMQPVQPVQPLAPAIPQQAQTPVNNMPVTPSTTQQNYSVSQSEHHTGKSFLKVLFLLIFIIGATAAIVVAGYKYMGVNSNSIQNANVYAEPTKPPVTPTPSVYTSNPNDTSNSAIDKDTQVTNNGLSNLNSSLNAVDQSLSDQQTNLQ